MALRSIYVATGSTVVHQFHDNEYNKGARFNVNSGPGSFSVSGSFTAGYVHYGASHTPNTIERGLLSNGLFRIPSYHGTTDAASLISLANPAALSAGDYNGAIFYMGAAGYSGANANALYHFSRANCLYFCRNGVWYPGWYAPQSTTQESTEDPFSTAETLNYVDTFEYAKGWDGTLTITNLTSSSTFEEANRTASESLTPSVVDVSSFSAWATASDIVDNFTQIFEVGDNFFGAETTPSPSVDFTEGSGLTDNFTQTYEQGSDFHGTEQSPSPSPDWADLTTYYEGFEDW